MDRPTRPNCFALIVSGLLVATSCSSGPVEPAPTTLVGMAESEATTTSSGTQPSTSTTPTTVTFKSDSTTTTTSKSEADDSSISQDAIDFAATIGAEQVLLLAQGREDSTYISVSGGESRVAGSGTREYLYSDGDLIWSYAYSEDQEWSSTTVEDFTGGTVCEQIPEGYVAHFTRNSTGELIAAIDTSQGQPGEPPSSVAYNCDTGESTPIEPLSEEAGEAESSGTATVGGRKFTWVGDAEGNAIYFNEADVSLNGDDYAGYHTFTSDGSQVFYQDMSGGIHWSSTLISRSTDDGGQRWKVEFGLTIVTTNVLGETLVVTLGDRAEVATGTGSTSTYVILDLETGEELQRGPTNFSVIGLG